MDGGTDGQESDPISVPLFPFEVRNLKNIYIKINGNMTYLNIIIFFNTFKNMQDYYI